MQCPRTPMSQLLLVEAKRAGPPFGVPQPRLQFIRGDLMAPHQQDDVTQRLFAFDLAYLLVSLNDFSVPRGGKIMHCLWELILEGIGLTKANAGQTADNANSPQPDPG